MSQERLPMVKIREVLRLQAEGHKQRKIAASVNCSRSTVQECLQRARSAGVGWPLPEDLDEQTLQAKLYPSKAKAVLTQEPDFDRVLRELARPHVTRRSGISPHAGPTFHVMPVQVFTACRSKISRQAGQDFTENQAGSF